MKTFTKTSAWAVVCSSMLAQFMLTQEASAEPFAYAANEKSGTVSIIDTATNAVIGDIAAGKKPRGMATSKDGKTLYVSDQPEKALQVIDIASRKVTGKIDLGESPEGVYRSPDGKWIAVAIEEDNSVHFIDTASGKTEFSVKTEGKRLRNRQRQE